MSRSPYDLSGKARRERNPSPYDCGVKPKRTKLSGCSVGMFPHRLKALRIMQGLTQQELADRCGWTEGTISHFECSQRSPSLESFVTLCNALNCNPDQLLLKRLP